MCPRKKHSQIALSGGKPEDAWTGRLAAALRERGLNAEGPSPLFHLSLGGKQKVRKPDFAVYDGVIHVGSAKVGSRLEVESLTSAQEYSQQIPLAKELAGKEIGEVFAVTYPDRGEKNFILHILARTGIHNEIPLITDSFEELVDHITKAIAGEFAEVLVHAEPTQEEAKRLLYNGAFNLADTLTGVSQLELEDAFGGHSFFRSVLATQIDPEKTLHILKLGSAFLFVNQILFYSLLSKESQCTDNAIYPQIIPEHADSPEELQLYFERVRDQNYEPIYGINISHLFVGSKSRLACKSIVLAIQALVPKLDTTDIAGQVFQTLIPFEIRKPLGAHFTNPNAAILLANIAISNSNETILDPACGSGTLLVSSYKRKIELAKDKSAKTHQKFVEEQITGIDVMAFSGHLAAVNLALQRPLFETDHVRIGTIDSTSLRPGSIIPTTGESLPSEFKQTDLIAEFPISKVKQGSRKRTIKMGRKEAHDFRVGQVDIVIMNPPFTSWDNMDLDYRNRLRTRFSFQPTYRDMIYFKPSQQLFFLFLADLFLKEGGRIAAVLPLTTFTAKSFHQFIRFVVSKYSVEAVFVGLGRAAYSEDTSLTECLFVAKKEMPDSKRRFILIGTKKEPDSWSQIDIINLAEQIKNKSINQDAFSIRKSYLQSDLLPEKRTLSSLYLSLLEEYDIAISKLETLIEESLIPLVEFGKLTEQRQIDATECVFSGRRFFSYGPKALIVSGTKERAIRKTDRLFLDGKKGSKMILRDKVTNSTYIIPSRIIKPAIRRFSYYRSLDISTTSDFVITKITPEVETLIRSLYSKREATRIINRVRAEWSKMIARGSSGLCMMWRVDWGAVGTTLICVRSETPAFLVIKGKYFTGLTDPTQEKLLCMWFNSSFFITSLLGRARITRGSYMDLEEYAIDRCPVPDVGQLTQEQRHRINQLWERISKIEVPSLIEQLECNHPFRVELDNGLLQILGISDPERRESLATIFRRGIYTAIKALQDTMR
jgi:hypothetical protein